MIWFVTRCWISHQLFITSNVLSTLRQVDNVANQESKAKLRDIDRGI